MKIIFAGTPEPAAVALRHLIDDDRIEVVAVITQPDAPRGRGRSLHPSRVAEVASAHNIPTHKWAGLKESTPEGIEARATLRQLAADGVTAVAVVAYGNLIPADMLDIVEHGWINLHYSLLPRWRGAAPVQAALAAGDEETGASVFQIEQGMDTGPVIATMPEPIGIEDTADDLLTRLTYSGRELLADALVDLHEGRARLTEQDHERATHAGKISAADARIDWTAPAEQIQRTARAHTPAPGAWTQLDQQRYKIGMMLAPAEDQAASLPPLSPGQLYATKNDVFVGTGPGSWPPVLRILSVQPPGKKMMNAADWARGQQDLLSSNPRCDSPDS